MHIRKICENEPFVFHVIVSYKQAVVLHAHLVLLPGSHKT